jgi:hypothetical protein
LIKTLRKVIRNTVNWVVTAGRGSHLLVLSLSGGEVHH